MLDCAMCADSVSSSPPTISDPLTSNRITAAYLKLLNRNHTQLRYLDGRPENIVDESLLTAAEATERRSTPEDIQAATETKAQATLNSRAFDDLTDLTNMDFIYVL